MASVKVDTGPGGSWTETSLVPAAAFAAKATTTSSAEADTNVTDATVVPGPNETVVIAVKSEPVRRKVDVWPGRPTPGVTSTTAGAVAAAAAEAAVAGATAPIAPTKPATTISAVAADRPAVSRRDIILPAEPDRVESRARIITTSTTNLSAPARTSTSLALIASAVRLRRRRPTQRGAGSTAPMRIGGAGR